MVMHEICYCCSSMVSIEKPQIFIFTSDVIQLRFTTQSALPLSFFDHTKQKTSYIIINVMLGSRTRTQFSICFNQQNSFAPVFMIASNRLHFYFIRCLLCSILLFDASNVIRKFFAVFIIVHTPHNKICNILVEEYGLKSFYHK